MYKLVDFLSSNQKTRTQRKKKVKKKGRDSATKKLNKEFKEKEKEKKKKANSDKKLVFTHSEKEEIKQTVKTLNRETSRILTSQFRQLDLVELAKDLELDTLLPLDENNSETSSVNEDSIEEKDIKKQDDSIKNESSSEEYNSGTFCVKDLKNSGIGDEVEDDGGYNSGTFCMKDITGGTSEADDEEDYGGTFCIRSSGPSKVTDNDSPIPAFMTAKRSETDPSMNRKQPNTNGKDGSAPNFSQMFREPENWEKHILALEKGEWTQGMEQNGAFKRWKKERPAMPSIYLKASNDESD